MSKHFLRALSQSFSIVVSSNSNENHIHTAHFRACVFASCLFNHTDHSFHFRWLSILRTHVPILRLPCRNNMCWKPGNWNSSFLSGGQTWWIIRSCFFTANMIICGFNVTSGGSPKVNKEQRAMQIEGKKVQNYVENMLLNRCGRRFTLFLFGFYHKNQIQTPHSCRRVHLVFWLLGNTLVCGTVPNYGGFWLVHWQPLSVSTASFNLEHTYFS